MVDTVALCPLETLLEDSLTASPRAEQDREAIPVALGAASF